MHHFSREISFLVVLRNSRHVSISYLRLSAVVARWIKESRLTSIGSNGESGPLTPVVMSEFNIVIRSPKPSVCAIVSASLVSELLSSCWVVLLVMSCSCSPMLVMFSSVCDCLLMETASMDEPTEAGVFGVE